MHHRDGGRVVEVEQEIAVGHSVHAVGRDGRKAQLVGHHLAVQRIGRARKRRRTQRQHVGGLVGVAQAGEVAREHPVVREHVVGEEDGLRLLHMRVAGHDDAEVVAGDVEQGGAQVEHLVHEAVRELFGVVARVGGHLVVAAAACVQAPARRADGLGQLALDGHVDVLVGDVELETAVLDAGGDAVEPGLDGIHVLGRNDAAGPEHARVRLRAGDVAFPHGAIHGQRGAEGLGEVGGRVLEASAPQCVVVVRALVLLRVLVREILLASGVTHGRQHPFHPVCQAPRTAWGCPLF